MSLTVSVDCKSNRDHTASYASLVNTDTDVQAQRRTDWEDASWVGGGRATNRLLVLYLHLLHGAPLQKEATVLYTHEKAKG